jgi:hypothetical protein
MERAAERGPAGTVPWLSERVGVVDGERVRWNPRIRA